MIAAGDVQGNQVIQNLVDALTNQTKSLQRVIATLDMTAIDFEGSDSLDNPNAVLQ